MKLLDRAKSWLGFGNGAQGGAVGFGEFGTPFIIESNGDGWQRSLNVDTLEARHVSIVYACVMLYCRAVSQCLPRHLVRSDAQADEQTLTSPASRVLRIPNEYETWHQFIYNVVAEMMFEGESLAFKTYDDRGAVKALHRVGRRNWSIHVDPETKSIFYGINATDLFDKPLMLVPMRDVVHFRQHCPRHPLIGESSVKAAAMAVGINVALNRSQMHFFSQMNRPSGVLSTDASLTPTQITQLRSAFNEQSKMWAQGGTPILSNGLKWTGLNLTQADSQLIEQQRLSAIDVARVFSIPMALLAEGAGPQAGTSALITTWLSIGLGAVIESIERSLDRGFSFGPSDHVQLDTAPLLRSDPVSRAEMWAKNVQSGVMTINEVRQREGLKPQKGCDEPLVQQQMVPVSVGRKLHEADIASRTAPKPAPVAPAAPEEDEPTATPAKELDGEITRALVVELFERKRAA